MSLQELKANSVTVVPAVALDLVTNEFLTFRLGGEEYRIEILKVQEIRGVRFHHAYCKFARLYQGRN